MFSTVRTGKWLHNQKQELRFPIWKVEYTKRTWLAIKITKLAAQQEKHTNWPRPAVLTYLQWFSSHQRHCAAWSHTAETITFDSCFVQASGMEIQPPKLLLFKCVFGWNTVKLYRKGTTQKLGFTTKATSYICQPFKHCFITIHITTTATKASIQQVHTKGLPQLSTSFPTAAHEVFLNAFHSKTKQRMILSGICTVLPQLPAPQSLRLWSWRFLLHSPMWTCLNDLWIHSNL